MEQRVNSSLKCGTVRKGQHETALWARELRGALDDPRSCIAAASHALESGNAT